MCEKNFFEVFSGTTELKDRIVKFCGVTTERKDTIKKKSNILYLRFFSDYRVTGHKFTALFTAVRKREKDSEYLNICKSFTQIT